MNRLLVALLAAFDALVAAAGGLAIALAPLALLWVFALGGGADWAALWPASAAVWQLGHLVPLTIHLPGTYLAAAGIDPSAADFALSLAPLGFAVFTALFAARSGGRAARAGEPLTGAVSGSLVFAALTALVALTGATPFAETTLWQALLFPALVYAVPCALGAAVGAWAGGEGAAGRLRDRVERAGGGWGAVPGLIVRGAAIAALGVVAVGALLFAVAVLARAGQVVALFEAGNVDAIGATVLALGQLAYLPTLVIWSASFVAGPGFALGTGTAVSPSGTQLGVVPGLPVLGVIPESTSPWLLTLALLPVAAGALAGWMLRSRLVAEHPGREHFGPRVVVVVGMSVLTGAVFALLAVCARGAIGPGRLAEAGPEPGPVALAVGMEVAVGAAILMLAPHRGSSSAGLGATTTAAPVFGEARDDVRWGGEPRDDVRWNSHSGWERAVPPEPWPEPPPLPDAPAGPRADPAPLPTLPTSAFGTGPLGSAPREDAEDDASEPRRDGSLD
ncbi:DUF6350 family protein [Microbacterium lushaniae]|uniref:cell division protein PerM n=1 Tax=Microbacterium lushaniae TaxID=2614639 RepID=UPI00178755D8|nr:DUF6350 family protein [Microbacterium lushaniae]